MRHLGKLVPFLVLAACGGGGDGPAAPPGATGNPGTGTGTGTNAGGGNSTSSSITVADNAFSPNATTVPRGTTVTWTWAGRNQHDVTFDDGTASRAQAAGTFTRTFSAAGTFRYHCTIHGAGMSGAVTVQ